MFTHALLESALILLSKYREHGLRISTAESCTGGLLSALLTEIPGSSDVFDRGFVTYSYASKTSLLGVSPEVLSVQGAVCEAVAIAMAQGALANSEADVTVAITGVAGPGSSEKKPAGTVHIAVLRKGRAAVHVKLSLPDDMSRGAIRLRSVEQALILLAEQLEPVMVA